jgi:uncharacterized protein with HEPN domain/predicted nucleotidyltransferase
MQVREPIQPRGRGKRVQRRRTGAELVRLLRAQMPELVEQYGVKSLGVFGSYVRAEQKPRSDLDVLVEFDEQHAGFANLVRLQDALQEALGLEVDLIENKGLRPYIGKRILAEVIWLRRDGEDLSVRLPRRKLGVLRMSTKREYLDYLSDILQAMDRAEQYTAGKELEEFIENNMAVDALSKVIENIGEATKHIPTEVRKRHPELDWKAMAGTRDHIAHGYFALDLPRLWHIATVLVPMEKPLVAAVLEKETERRRAEEEEKKGDGKKGEG